MTTDAEVIMTACINVLRFLILVLVLFFVPSEGWMGTKNCLCKVVSKENSGLVYHDFSVIQRCHQPVFCPCKHPELVSCGTDCVRKVEEWVCDGCPGLAAGSQVRAHYTAERCHGETAPSVFTCGQKQNCQTG